MRVGDRLRSRHGVVRSRSTLGPSPAVIRQGVLLRASRAAARYRLEALQIAIRATPTEAVVHGVVPVDPEVYCHTNNHADARCPVNNTSNMGGVPFRIVVAL